MLRDCLCQLPAHQQTHFTPSNFRLLHVGGNNTRKMGAKILNKTEEKKVILQVITEGPQNMSGLLKEKSEKYEYREKFSLYGIYMNILQQKLGPIS
jgi:hypothetical protein